LSVAMGSDVNLVNAPILAKERQLKITGKKDPQGENETPSLSIRVVDEKETMTLKATVGTVGGFITELNGNSIELHPEGNLLYIENTDTPGVVGHLGTFLGAHKINISSMQLSRAQKGGAARTFLGLDDEMSKELIDELKKKEFIVEARFIKI
ncbi:MAG TPA: ACT domain-containing protein, partial [Turneriella sp.]|nr:ACT domain-containing protein [Turneriella sp.]